MNMPMDYEVFEPNDEHIAQLIVGILEEKGYTAGYQLGYPHNKVFIKVEVKEEADKISGIIRKFMKKSNLADRGITTSTFNTLTSKLGNLISEPPNRKLESPIENIERQRENNDVYHPEKSENEVYRNVKLEELRSKIDEKLNQVNALIAQNPKDRSNEKRRIERDTLVWVLQNMP
jgi:vacuolar-type H+-ATPase subunit I/STV1